jgi:predicted alpha/beta-hydrolase family hydrolase
MGGAVRVETPDGPAELVLDEADAAAAVLLLGHGAGGDVDAWDLGLLACRLPELGVSVARFRQPYRVAGRRVFSSAPALDRAWACALAAVREAWPRLPLFTGGRSAGARVACRGADAGQHGLVLLSFPLHPPGKPAKSRAEELTGAGMPALVVQGGADAFGTPAELRAAVGDVAGLRLIELPGATHGLGPAARTSPEVVADRERRLVWAVSGFIESLLRQPPAPAGTP